MFGHMILMAAMMGQTTVDAPRTDPGLSEQAKKAQARALAEFRANQHTIKPRLEAYYQLENQRLTEKTATVNTATGRVLFFAAGARSDGLAVAGGSSGFSSVPPTAPRMAREYQAQPAIAPRTAWEYQGEWSLSELQRENFLIKGRLRDSRYLYRESNRIYSAEYPIRMKLAGTPFAFGQR